MAQYVALIHKTADSSYGVSFPDLPGVTSAGDTIDAVIEQASEALAFAAEDWADLVDKAFPAPRTIDQLRDDPEFIEDAADAMIAVIALKASAMAAA